MKISIDIDCTPAEMRAFFGLAEVQTMQENLMAGMEERFREAMARMDPEAILEQWFGGVKGFEAMQKKFWKDVTGSRS